MRMLLARYATALRFMREQSVYMPLCYGGAHAAPVAAPVKRARASYVIADRGERWRRGLMSPPDDVIAHQAYRLDTLLLLRLLLHAVPPCRPARMAAGSRGAMLLLFMLVDILR